MNIRTSFIAVGATLALVAPAAANARAIVNQKGDTYLASKHGSHALANSTNFVSENGNRIAVKSSKATHTSGKTTTAGKTSVPVSKPHVIYRAPFGPTSIVTPGYIYVPGPAAGASAYVDPNECQDSGTNCTDNQLCTYWGENCDSSAAEAQSPAAQTVAQNDATA